MLDVARQKFRTGERIEFQSADATALPFPDGTFDAVVCQFGVMFFPDKDKAYREAFRVLAPGGRYHFNVWDSFDFNPFARIVHETVGSFFGADVPRFYTIPFGYHRIDPIKASLVDAGFADISMHVFRLDKTISQARLFAEGLILGNPIVEEICARGMADPAEIIDAVTAALRREFGQDPGRMPLQAIVFGAIRRGEVLPSRRCPRHPPPHRDGLADLERHQILADHQRPVVGLRASRRRCRRSSAAANALAAEQHDVRVGGELRPASARTRGRRRAASCDAPMMRWM